MSIDIRSLFALALLSSACLAAEQPALVITPLKPGSIYGVGETVGWTVSAPPGSKIDGEYSFALKQNSLAVIKEGKLNLSAPATVETKLSEPAMLYLEIKGPDADAQPVAAGAAIAPDRLQPAVPKPADFDQFWSRKIRALQQVPANPVLTPKQSDRPDVEYFLLKMDHIDGRHIYGQVAKPRVSKNGGTGKFPGMAIFQWASPPYPLQKQWVTDRAAEGWLVVNIEPHDVLPDQPQSYYDALPKELKEYHTIGRTDRDKNYFLQMYLADYRAIEYLASRPDWNGTTLVATGTSMGGQQSLCAAGLNPKVTGVVVHVPAGADTSGPLHGRASGYPFWPVDDPKIVETARYFDTVNCAMSVKVPTLVSMGFIDTTTLPAGQFAMFNQLRGYKEAAPLFDAPHNHRATVEQQEPFTRRSAEWLKTLVAGGDVAEPAYKASPRLDRNSHLAHEQLLEKKTRGQIDVYFLGDSITRRWGASDDKYRDLLANWKQNFFGWNAADFGWGADKTQNILWRLENGELDGVQPKVIVLMAGTNNVGRLTPLNDNVGGDDPRVTDVTKGIKAIVDLCRKKAPKATIVLTGITPRNDNIAVMPIIDRINANIARFADGKSIRYVNINDRLADRNGKLFDGVTDPDQLHLTTKAYQAWADALKPIFTELLGPAAAMDHAPPPTGDPSAAATASSGH